MAIIGRLNDRSILDTNATKRWQVRRDPAAMKQRTDKALQCPWTTAAVAPFGSRRLSQMPARVMLAFLVLLSAHAAYAESRTGQTSSASVEISISIASRYKLQSVASSANANGQPTHDRLCLAANTPGPLMAVMLVQDSRREPSMSMPGTAWTRHSAEFATELKACGLSGHSPSHTLEPIRLSSNLPVLVRPE